MLTTLPVIFPLPPGGGGLAPQTCIQRFFGSLNPTIFLMRKQRRSAGGLRKGECLPMANNQRQSCLLFLHAQTALHPGAGTALGVVDLPVQRERHTQWPLVPASSLKGVLRAACHASEGAESAELKTVFGPPTQDADKYSGALACSDARLLAFPVRSLKGVFAWVTCPAMLERLRRDATLTGVSADFSIPSLKPGEAACAKSSDLTVSDGTRMVLEEFEFNMVGHDIATIAGWIAEHAIEDEATANRLQTHLVVLHDNDFTHFVRHATEVVARIGLDYARKTVSKGALFYQEFLPPECLFYSMLIASPARRNGDEGAPASLSAPDVLGYLKKSLEPPVVQIGGDETTGKGLCLVRFSDSLQEVTQ